MAESPPDDWELASSSSEETPAPEPEPEPEPATVVQGMQCSTADTPPQMLQLLLSADRAHVVEWEHALVDMIKRGAKELKFAPLAPELRKALSYTAYTFGLEYKELPNVHGNAKLAVVLSRTKTTAVPHPKLTDLNLASVPQHSLWPTQRESEVASAFDPRHQKGSSTKVMIMKRSEHHSKEEIQRQELAKLEAAARSRNSSSSDKHLEYQLARARIFDGHQPPEHKEPPQHQPNQAKGPQSGGFGRGKVLNKSVQPSLDPRGPESSPTPSKWSNSALGNQSRNLDNMVDPDYDRSQWEQQQTQPESQRDYWSEFPDL